MMPIGEEVIGGEMCTVGVTIPDAVLYDAHMSQSDAQEFVRKSVALAMYKRLNASLGYCSQIVGLSEADFILFLGSQGESVFRCDGEDELAEDMQVALRAAVA